MFSRQFQCQCLYAELIGKSCLPQQALVVQELRSLFPATGKIFFCNASPVAGLEAEKLAIKGAPGMYLRMPIVGLITAREIFTSKQLSVRKIMWPPGQECLALHRVLMTNTSIFIAAHLVECQKRSLGDFVN